MSFVQRAAMVSAIARFHPLTCVWGVALTLSWVLPAAAGPSEDLISAADRGDAPRVQALLARGTDVNARAKNGATALMLASQRGTRKWCEFCSPKEPISMPR